MINKICEYDKCTGCSACASICPTHCISMQPDNEGFLRPNIANDQCINCGKCRKTCPINHEFQDDGVRPASFAVRNRDKDILLKSSSGGLFSALAQYVLRNNGVVIGAGFDDNLAVAHKVCIDERGMDELRRSKYVQSKIGKVYQSAKQLLEAGKTVLFCGTPCQVGGLKSYLGKEFANLYAIDFICHGVPSPMVWNTYLNFRKNQAGSDVKEVSFRSKDDGWKHYSMKIKFDNDTQYSAKVSEDIYLRSFIMDMDLRPSCYQCQFKQFHRVSDITLADFWGVEKIGNRWNDDKGVSLALVHSEQGQKLLDLCSDWVEMIPVSFDAAVASNPSMTKSVIRPPLRKNFMRDIQKLPFNEVHRKYCGTGFGARIRRKLVAVMKTLWMF